MEEALYKKLKNKGYACDCECKFHQIKILGIKENNIPNLKSEKRIGVIKRLAVKDKKIEGKKIEQVETENTVLKKVWYESWGITGEMVVVLEKSEKKINSVEEIEKNLDFFVKFVSKKDEELNKYNKKVVLMGIKSLFELGEISYWDKTVYILLNTNSTGKSAGVPLLLSFYSTYYGVEIPNNLSATGEIDTENGNIKGIGGLKEKVICAIRNLPKIDNLILPQENYEEVQEILNAYYKRFTVSKKLNPCPVSNCNDLLPLLFQWKN